MKKFLVVCLFLSGVKEVASQTFKELNDSLIYYYQSKNLDKAIPFAEKLIVFVQNNYGEENKINHTYLNMLAGLYIQKGQFKKSEEVLIKANRIIQKLNGDKNEELIKGYLLLAVVYNGSGQENKAIPLLKKAMEFYKNEKGENDPDYGATMNKLGRVYEGLGLYNEAEPLFITAAEIRKKANGPESLEYATTLNNLGLLYKNFGKPEKAEPLLLTALQIRKKTGGENSSDFANSLNNVAVFYATIGQNEKAETFYKKAASIYKETNGVSSSTYITCLTNIGELYSSMDRYAEAEVILLEALDIINKNFEESRIEKLNIIRTLGQLYLSIDSFDKAEPLLLKVVSLEKEKSETTLSYAGAINDIAYLYNHTGRIKEAEIYYEKSAVIIREFYGEQHSDYSTAISNQASLYQKQGRFAEAVSAIAQINKLKTANLLELFSVLSEAEKLAYMDGNFNLLQTNLSLLAAYPEAPSTFYQQNFDLLLLLKSMQLTDGKNLLESVRNSSDSAVRTIFNEWKSYKAVLAKEYSLPEYFRRQDLNDLKEVAEVLEKKLITVSSGIRRLYDNAQIKTTDVYNKLKEDEAAIEFVKFHNIESINQEGYNYGAFILTKKDTVPTFVLLCKESALQQLFDSAGISSITRIKSFYRGLDLGSTGNLPPSVRLYNLIWAPLEPFLNGVKHIIYSPAGKLYSIAFQALPVDSNTLLIDKYNLQQLTSTRILAARDTMVSGINATDIVLFGNADFSMDSISIVRQRKNKNNTVSTNVYAPLKNEITNEIWKNLPGTADEIEKITALFRRNGKKTTVFTKQKASEENLKELSGKSPPALHIATHGFFLQQQDRNLATRANAYIQADDPLLRSGIILAGGNYAWSGKLPVEGAEDGIMTALEIAQLDLSNTELVVLSACETGLGDVKGNEGVFGLQRAFKMAGVKKMIVSLWQVPDKETAELMTSFYSYWMQGKSINEAFVQAQSEMRKKYPPYYWAAFMLVE